MADTPQKRDARQFEPPPWERDRFEELKREQERQLAAEKEAAKAEAEAEAQPPETAAESTEVPAPEPEPVTARPAEPGPPAAAPSAEGRAGSVRAAERSASAMPESHIDTMLIQLGAEEPKIEHQGWVFTAIASAVLAVVGLDLVVWGATAVSRSTGASSAGGVAGLIGSGTMITFGLLALAGAVWAGLRSLRQRGALQ